MNIPANMILLVATILVTSFNSAQSSENDRRDIIIAGTGDSQTLLRRLKETFEKNNPSVRLVIPESIGSAGGIRELIKGDVDLARTARSLKKTEKPGLNEFEIAKVPVVFATHPSIIISNLTTEQVVGIYSNKYNRWSDVGGPEKKIYVVDREKGDSSRSILEKNISGFKDVKSVGKIFYSVPATKLAIGKHKFTIGYLPLPEAIDQQLNILSIDGVFPDERTISNNSYPYFNTLYIVSKGKPSGLVKDFFQFIYSKETRKNMKNFYVYPTIEHLSF